jgi:dTDP-4-dehydrorhamnose reductase
MRVAIIGTSGQLATELRRRPLPSGLELLPAVKLDITDAIATTTQLASWQPQIVINASAYTAVDRAEGDVERAFAVNADGPSTLAAWCTGSGAALVHVSTDYVFDGTLPRSYRETDPTAPLGVYGQSKLAGEEVIRRTCSTHTIFRTSWVVSAHGHNFVKTMLRLANEREELLAANRIAGGNPCFGTFHFAGAGETTWHGFAQAIVEEQEPYAGKKPRVTPITTSDYPTPAQRPQNSVLDTTAFETVFGYTPRSWRDGLSEIVRELNSS